MEEHCLLIKRKIHQKDIAFCNIYVPNTKAYKFTKKQNNEKKYYRLNHILTLTH